MRLESSLRHVPSLPFRISRPKLRIYALEQLAINIRVFKGVNEIFKGVNEMEIASRVGLSVFWASHGSRI